jgi:integrase
MGRGTVYHRPDGRWSAQISVNGTRETVYGKTQAEAVDRLQVLQNRVKGGLPHIDQRGTVGGYLQAWLEATRAGIRPSTARRYEQIIRYQLVPRIGKVKLAQLQSTDVGRMLSQLHQDGLSAQTCSHVRAVLRAALNDAVEDGRLVRNPAVGKVARPPRVPDRRQAEYSPEQVLAVLDALPDPGLRRLASIAVASGLRQGELLGLQWGDLADGQLRVSRALQRVSGTYQLVEPKSLSSRRKVPLSAGALETLEVQRREQDAARESAGREWKEPLPGLMWTSDSGKPISGSSLTHRFEDAVKAAGLPVLRWHDLRHAYATLLLNAGVELAAVSHLLGHSNVSLTAKTYAGIGPSLRQDAATTLGGLLQRPA